MDVFDAVIRNHRRALCNEAVAAAKILGVFKALTTPSTALKLATTLKVSPHRLRALLQVLVHEGYLEHLSQDVWALGSTSHLSIEGFGLCHSIVEVLRNDHPMEGGDWPLPSDALERYHSHLLEVGAEAARELFNHLHLRPGVLLDAGGGAGCYSRAYLESAPNTCAVLADRAEVVQLARAHQHTNERLTFIEGNILSDDVGNNYDHILIANVTHLYGKDDCQQLIARLSERLVPEGTLVVKDLWIEPDRSGPTNAVYFALNMALYTEAGDVYDPATVQTWVKEAGLEKIAVHRLKSGGLVVTGQACATESTQT